MTKEKDLDLILLSEPLNMGIDGVHIYGGIFSRSESENYKVPYEERVQLFVEYLAGVSEWVKSGNDMSMDGYFLLRKGNIITWQATLHEIIVRNHTIKFL